MDVIPSSGSLINRPDTQINPALCVCTMVTSAPCNGSDAGSTPMPTEDGRPHVSHTGKTHYIAPDGRPDLVRVTYIKTHSIARRPATNWTSLRRHARLCRIVTYVRRGVEC